MTFFQVPGQLAPVAPVPVPGELPSVPELPELPDVDLADYLDAINQLEANNELLARIIDDLLATLLPRVVDSTNVKRVVELLNNLRNLITYVIEKLRVYDLVPSQNLIALINALNLVLDVVLPLLPILLPPIGQSAQAPPPSDKPLDQLVDCIFTSVAYILDIVLPIIGAIIDKLNAYLAQIVPERQGTLNDLGKSLTAIASDAATLTGTVTDIVNVSKFLLVAHR